MITHAVDSEPSLFACCRALDMVQKRCRTWLLYDSHVREALRYHTDFSHYGNVSVQVISRWLPKDFLFAIHCSELIIRSHRTTANRRKSDLCPYARTPLYIVRVALFERVAIPYHSECRDESGNLIFLPEYQNPSTSPGGPARTGNLAQPLVARTQATSGERRVS